MPEQRISPADTTGLVLEIAHLLFIDVVGYSKLLIDEQIASMQMLKGIVRGTPAFKDAEAAGKLTRIPTGDGMILLFFRSPDEPVRCALEISESLRDYPQIQLRMGIHSGPVNRVVDVNDEVNVAGTGINIGQRVMDCGDAGHILLSKHIAEDLAQYQEWRPYVHDLGECEVKHGHRLHVFNLTKEGIGNPEVPEILRRSRRWISRSVGSMGWQQFVWLIASLLLMLALAFVFVFHRARLPDVVAPEKSVAVLPFENLSSQRENAFFAEGMQDEILVDLAKVADLKVISRTSVMQYKSGTPRNVEEISRQLGVAHVLEGSVQRMGNHIRVNAQLIDARTDTYVWAQRYDRDLADVFAIQSEIAKAIADQLKAKISPSEKAAIEEPPTADLAAFELYERAKALWADVTDPIHAKDELPEAARLLDEAVGRDPRFLQAWCLLSRVHDTFYWYGFDHTVARLELANRALQKAVHLQPDAGETHLALANYYYYGFRDYARARGELAIARQTLPNNAEVFEYTGFIDRREGHWTESTGNIERALQLDPRNFFILQQLAVTYEWQRRYADEIAIYDRALTIVPADPLTRISRAEVAVRWRADLKPYEATLATLLAEDPSVAPDVDHIDIALCQRSAEAVHRALANYPRDGASTEYGVNCPHSYWEGVVAWWQGNSVKAQGAFGAARESVAKIVERQPDFPAALSLLGIIDAALGRKEEALREGRRACELLPISKDALSGAAIATNLAQIYAWTGEKDLAIEQIAQIERVPNELNYGFLKLHPFWDSLRGDSRFEKIIASLEPRS